MFAIDELLRIGAEPEAVAVEKNAITFFLPGEVFVRSSLFADPWPNPKPPLTAAFLQYTPSAIPASLLEALERIRPLLDPRVPAVCFEHNTVRTLHDEIAAEVIGFDGLGECRFYAEPLTAVLKAATEVDWTAFPRVPWRGENGISGVLLGLRT